MPTLTVTMNGADYKLPFEGQPMLSTVLEAHGFYISKPCGGRGACGKCIAAMQGAISAPTQAEEKLGVRLVCQTQLLGDASVSLPDTNTAMQIETGNESSVPAGDPFPGRIGAAVDIGTTTIVLRLVSLETGRTLSHAAMRNPQTAVAADVMGRIGAAIAGQSDALRCMVVSALASLMESACHQAGMPQSDIAAFVITGNTTMLYLLTGRDPTPLSHAPFDADCLFGCEDTLLGIPAYYPPCMNAFVGADVTCAVLASGMCDSTDTALLCDVGTNGEIALWKDGQLYVTSTAAGPAFEGAGISCGCGSIRGAIDRVWTVNGRIAVGTIGDEPAVGLCGSGLIDAIAAGLAIGEIDESGAMEEDEMTLSGHVRLLPRDVRAVQLAKAAIAAGIGTLLHAAGISADDVKRLYIAGGFGSHLNLQSAAAIGLLPRCLIDRTTVLGNAAMTGAQMMLLNRASLRKADLLAKQATPVSLGGHPLFNELYIESMMFDVASC